MSVLGGRCCGQRGTLLLSGLTVSAVVLGVEYPSVTDLGHGSEQTELCHDAIDPGPDTLLLLRSTAEDPGLCRLQQPWTISQSTFDTLSYAPPRQ